MFQHLTVGNNLGAANWGLLNLFKRFDLSKSAVFQSFDKFYLSIKDTFWQNISGKENYVTTIICSHFKLPQTLQW